VRQPGLSALAELSGNEATVKRPGPKIAKRVDDLRNLAPEVLREYAYWTRALDALHEAYGGICAYSCFYIDRPLSPTVDHFVAITKTALADAYEWENYRLACSLMNACKREFPDVLDPFDVKDDWFALDLNTLRVKPNEKLDDPSVIQRIESTIVRLGLNERDCFLARKRYFDLYWNPPDPAQPLPLWFLETQAPFLAREMRRQGRVRPEHQEKTTPVPQGEDESNRT
jgi:hypothetical protein